MFFLWIFISLASWGNAQTFLNPIIGGYGASPSILKLGDFYYLTLGNVNNTELTTYKSPILTNFQNVEKKVIFRVPDGFYYLETSEMVNIDGELYLYFNMILPNLNGLRTFVIKADNPSDPMGGWSDPIMLLHDWDYDGMDGVVLKHASQLYFVWTNFNSTKYSLFIAPMTSPALVGSPKVILKQPKEDWECRRICFNEGASFISNGNVTYMIYSANSYQSPDYCLGQMSIHVGDDPLVVQNWRIVDEPVFWRNDEEDVYAVGRAEFTVSPDGTETWMVYHASVSPVHIDGRQVTRIDKIEWNEDGSPKFPRPLGTHQSKRVPGGQHSNCS